MTAPSPRLRARRRGAGLLALLIALLLAAAGVLGWQALSYAREAAPERSPRPPALRGVNLAGGEFGPDGQVGAYGHDYLYPDATAAAPFLAAGMNTVRLPIRWERIQHAPFAELDPDEMARIDAALAALSGFDAIVLDVHNGARYRGVPLKDDAHSAAMLADLWQKLATRYGQDHRIVFGLMNEPVDIPAAAWRRIAETSVAAIRGTGAKGLVLVPGTAFTGAHSWTAGGDASNAAAFRDFRDPGKNFAFEMHQYFDWNSSGTNETCVPAGIAVGRFQAATDWLRETNSRAFLGEFGVARNDNCLAVLDRAMDYLDRNSDVWMGYAVWAGGGWWGDYPFTVQPDAAGPRPQMRVIARHLPH